MITLGKTKSVCPICMKVLTAKKCIGEDGIYLVKECDIHGKFQTLIWEGTAAEYLSWGRENLSAETPVNPKIKEKSCPDNCGLCEEHERKGCSMKQDETSAAICTARSALLRQENVWKTVIFQLMK